MDLPIRSVDKNGQLRGGRREGAGRKPKGMRAGAPHKQRPQLDPRHPQHVTLRVSDAVGWLRRLDTYTAVRRALRVVIAKHREFRILHFSLQNTHLHLICEASNKAALAAGLQGFQISAAKHINAAISRRRRLTERRRGEVFVDRYHAEDLGSPRQVRNALAYVINNWRRHEVDHGPFQLLGGRLDPYASGLAFTGWRERLPEVDESVPNGYAPPEVSEATTWLARQGWTKAPPISVYEVPGPRRIAVVDD
jgi:REP element-mobilizing transposase RayT